MPKPQVLFAVLLSLVCAGAAQAGNFTQCFGNTAANYYRIPGDPAPGDEQLMNFNDYGMFFHDALNPSCSATNVASRLDAKVRATPAAKWQEQFSGSVLSVVLATGLELGGRGALTESLDAALRDAINNYVFFRDPPCGIANVYPSGGANACFDDYTLAMSGYGWIVAYQRLTGRNFDNARYQLVQTINSAFHPYQSMCVHDPALEYDLDRPGFTSATDRAYCNGSTTNLGVGAGKSEILSMNHGNQTPAYGIGLMSSVAAAFAGLDVAETPIRSQDWTSTHRLYMAHILVEGRRKSTWESANGNFNFANAGSESCYKPEPNNDPNTSSWKPYVIVKSVLCGDDLFSLMTEQGGAITRYRANMYPVLPFYKKYGITDTIFTGGWSFAGGTFAETFADVTDASVADRWFGPFRRAVYKVMGSDWVYDSAANGAAGRPKTAGGQTALFGRDEYKIALGTGMKHFGVNGTTINSMAAKTDLNARWILKDLNGGKLLMGDQVTLRTPAGKYLTAVNGGGSVINASTTVQNSATNVFVIRRANSVTGPISDSDIITLYTPNGFIVAATDNSASEPTAHYTTYVSPGSSQYFLRLEF